MTRYGCTALSLAALSLTAAWAVVQPSCARAAGHGLPYVGASAGAGVGSVALVRPTAEGRQRLPDSAFAALDLGVRLRTKSDQALSFEIELAYQSSFDFAVEVDPLFGLGERVSVRVQRAELTLAPQLRLGASRRALSLAFPVGVMLRAFVPKLHQFELPNYVLAGPELRIELLAPLGHRVRVRIGPEVQWIAAVDHSLRDQGACCEGAALGARGSLEAALGSTFSIGLDVRISHAFVGAGLRAFTETVRYATAFVGGRL